MSDEVMIKKIIKALDGSLAEIEIADHMDALNALNALTAVMIETLKTVEYLTEREAYKRAAEVFANAATAAAAEEAAKAAAEAEAKRRRHATATNAQIKFEQFKKRQRRVAQRAAKRDRKLESET
jgi:hypothetical protein